MSLEPKIIYTIGEASRIVEVKPYVLRYWETEFDRLRPEKSVTGQRCYRPRDIRLALTLKRLLHGEGFTIAGARKRLTEMNAEEYDPFPMGEAAVDLPSGRSVEGTPDEGTAEEEVPPLASDALAEKSDPVPEPTPLTWTGRGEFVKLLEESERILAKHPI